MEQRSWWQQGCSTVTETISAIHILPPHIHDEVCTRLARVRVVDLQSVLEELPEPVHSTLLRIQAFKQSKESYYLHLELESARFLSLAALHSVALNLPGLGLDGLLLSSSKGTFSSITRLAEAIGSHTGLTHLRLDQLGVADAGAQELCRGLTSLSHLKQLLIFDSFSASALGAFAALIPELKELELFSISRFDAPCTDSESSDSQEECAQFVKAVAGATKLQYFYLAADCLPWPLEEGQGGFKRLQHLHLPLLATSSPCHGFIPALQHLTQLQLVHPEVSQDTIMSFELGDIKRYAKSCDFTGLWSQVPSNVLLSIGMPNECENGLHRRADDLFKRLCTLKSLRKLCLSSCRFCAYFEIAKWKGLEQLKHLQLLDIDQCVIDNNGGWTEKISILSSLRSLKLSLKSVIVNQRFFGSIPPLRQLTQLVVQHAGSEPSKEHGF